MLQKQVASWPLALVSRPDSQSNQQGGVGEGCAKVESLQGRGRFEIWKSSGWRCWRISSQRLVVLFGAERLATPVAMQSR